eukprot:GILK01006085.1.p1 GENE.GILK01006085.1~~GILK01006085.1.p1  ORF type:complete len:362 (-),score=22.15 GILK01006085.1:146-1174(-)
MATMLRAIQSKVNKLCLLDENDEKVNQAAVASYRTHLEKIRLRYTPFERVMEVAGRVGFFCKALIYGTIGAISIAAVFQEQDTAGPQGAFILLGNSAVGDLVLYILAVGVALYALWRFFESFTGQGFDHSAPASRNFFFFHLSPFVSGCMYTGYLVYLAKLISMQRLRRRAEKYMPTWLDRWGDSTGGRCGLALLGVAFIAAFCSQIRPALKGTFKADLRQDLKPGFRKAVYVLGHIGFAARAVTFLIVAVLFFRAATGDTEASGEAIGEALHQLTETWWGNGILFLIGLGLLSYALFAALNVYAKIFLPATSRRRTLAGDRWTDPSHYQRPLLPLHASVSG